VPDGVITPQSVSQVIVHHLVGRVVVHVYLFEDDLALGVDLSGFHQRVTRHVHDYLYGSVDMFLERLE